LRWIALRCAEGGGICAQSISIVERKEEFGARIAASRSIPGTARVPEDYPLASSCRHVPHGGRRSLWPRGPGEKYRLRLGHRCPVVGAPVLESSDRSHGERTVQRDAGGGGLLLLGSPGHGAFLGFPGSMVVAGRQHL